MGETEVVEQNANQEQANNTVENPPAEEAAQGGEHQQEDNWQEKFEAQRKVNRDLEKKLKGEAGTLKQQNEELRAKLEGREKEFAAEQQRREIEAEALGKANQRILQAEIRAAAAGKLNDPADALLYLDLSSFEVGDDGAVDTEAVTAAITDLTENKPYLAAQGGKRFQGSADGGAREASGPAQLSQADLAGMTSDEINTARAEGRLNSLLGRK